MSTDNNDFAVRLHYYGGLRPWHAFITQGATKLGESGSTTYASRTPEAALRKAMKMVAKIAPDSHPERITVKVEADHSW